MLTFNIIHIFLLKKKKKKTPFIYLCVEEKYTYNTLISNLNLIFFNYNIYSSKLFILKLWYKIEEWKWVKLTHIVEEEIWGLIPIYIKNWLVFWFDDKELSSGAGIITKKKKKPYIKVWFKWEKICEARIYKILSSSILNYDI